jgi:hypothetical protein
MAIAGAGTVFRHHFFQISFSPLGVGSFRVSFVIDELPRSAVPCCDLGPVFVLG